VVLERSSCMIYWDWFMIIYFMVCLSTNSSYRNIAWKCYIGFKLCKIKTSSMRLMLWFTGILFFFWILSWSWIVFAHVTVDIYGLIIYVLNPYVNFLRSQYVYHIQFQSNIKDLILLYGWFIKKEFYKSNFHSFKYLMILIYGID
jgi:hypothetical protein